MTEKILVFKANEFFDHLINSKVYNIANEKELIFYYWMRFIVFSILLRPMVLDHRYIFNPYER